MTDQPCAAPGATATANSTCCKCGHDPRDTGADFATCGSCGKVYCTSCVSERRASGADTACPCCGSPEALLAG